MPGSVRGCVGWSGEAGDDEVEDGVEVVLGEGVAADHVAVDDGSFDEVDCVIGVDSVGEFPAVASALEHVESAGLLHQVRVGVGT